MSTHDALMATFGVPQCAAPILPASCTSPGELDGVEMNCCRRWAILQETGLQVPSRLEAIARVGGHR